MSTDPQFWNPSNAPKAEVDDRGGVYRNETGQYDPRTDAGLHSGRDEAHAEAPVRDYGEGVITGDPADHYVHLANGAVVAGSSGGTHYHDPKNGLIPIVSVYPAGRALS